jgi:hypothetical protein
MRRIVLFLLGLFLFVLALNIIALPIPYSAARTFDSPVATPVRPTPTGWPHAPFSWQAERPEKEHAQPMTRGWAVKMVPIRTHNAR